MLVQQTIPMFAQWLDIVQWSTPTPPHTPPHTPTHTVWLTVRFVLIFLTTHSWPQWLISIFPLYKVKHCLFCSTRRFRFSVAEKNETFLHPLQKCDVWNMELIPRGQKWCFESVIIHWCGQAENTHVVFLMSVVLHKRDDAVVNEKC